MHKHLLVCLYMYHVNAVTKEGIRFPGSSLQMAVNCYVCAANRTWVLCKKRRCS